MEFFKNIKQFIPAGGTMTLSFSDKEDIMSCTVVYGHENKEIKKEIKITPFTLSGSAEELDQAFFIHIAKPLERVKAIVSNIIEVEEEAEKLEAERKKDKAAKDKAKAEKATTPAAKKTKKSAKEDKMDEAVKKAEEALAKKSFTQAVMFYQEARKHGYTESAEKIAEVNKQRDIALGDETPSMFDQFDAKKEAPEPAAEEAPADDIKLPAREPMKRPTSGETTEIIDNEEEAPNFG